MKILLVKKKMLKIREKSETIKKIKVRSLKKVFKFCDDNFFLNYFIQLKVFRIFISWK
jgi:hypothetical protein